MYWFSRAGPAASLRIYYEMSEGGTKSSTLDGVKWTNVPVGLSYFPGELIRFPKSCVSFSIIALITAQLTART